MQKYLVESSVFPIVRSRIKNRMNRWAGTDRCLAIERGETIRSLENLQSHTSKKKNQSLIQADLHS